MSLRNTLCFTVAFWCVSFVVTQEFIISHLNSTNVTVRNVLGRPVSLVPLDETLWDEGQVHKVENKRETRIKQNVTGISDYFNDYDEVYEETNAKEVKPNLHFKITPPKMPRDSSLNRPTVFKRDVTNSSEPLFPSTELPEPSKPVTLDVLELFPSTEPSKPVTLDVLELFPSTELPESSKPVTLDVLELFPSTELPEPSKPVTLDVLELFPSTELPEPSKSVTLDMLEREVDEDMRLPGWTPRNTRSVTEWKNGHRFPSQYMLTSRLERIFDISVERPVSIYDLLPGASTSYVNMQPRRLYVPRNHYKPMVRSTSVQTTRRIVPKPRPVHRFTKAPIKVSYPPRKFL